MDVFLFFLAALFTLIVIGGLFVSRQQQFSCHQQIQADQKTVYALLEDLTSWEQWSAWSSLNDSRLEVIPGEKMRGKNASFDWKGPKMGKGKLEVVEAHAYKSLVITTQFRNRRFKVQHDIRLQQPGNHTEIIWNSKVKTGWSSPSRILGRLLMRRFQQDVQTGLQILAQISAAA